MSLRLSRVTLREIRLALREPFEISSGVTTDRRILLLELEDVDGFRAWSECVAGERPQLLGRNDRYGVAGHRRLARATRTEWERAASIFAR